jgi:hypothetical protein
MCVVRNTLKLFGRITPLGLIVSLQFSSVAQADITCQWPGRDLAETLVAGYAITSSTLEPSHSTILQNKTAQRNTEIHRNTETPRNTETHGIKKGHHQQESWEQTGIHQESFWLWRYKNQVAQQNKTNGITKYWYHLPNNQVKSMLLFEQFNKAIEYDPNDLPTDTSEPGWQEKVQLVSDRQLASLTRVREQGTGCAREEVYQSHDAPELQLVWLPELKLVKYMKQRRDGKSVEWKLVKVDLNTSSIQKQFDTWMSFQTFDFADIGDNENDPFIRQMIALGFIEHAHGDAKH